MGRAWAAGVSLAFLTSCIGDYTGPVVDAQTGCCVVKTIGYQELGRSYRSCSCSCEADGGACHRDQPQSIFSISNYIIDPACPHASLALDLACETAP